MVSKRSNEPCSNSGDSRLIDLSSYYLVFAMNVDLQHGCGSETVIPEMGCPGKWNQALKPAVVWSNFDSEYPDGLGIASVIGLVTLGHVPILTGSPQNRQNRPTRAAGVGL